MKINKSSIYYLMSILGIFALCIIFFSSWNYTYSVKELPKNKLVEDFNITDCSFTNNYISIEGWSTIRGKERVLTELYAFRKDNNSWVRINKQTRKNEKINKSLNLSEYELVGFYGVKRILPWEDFNNVIMLVSHSQDGTKRSLTYDCNQ